MKGKKNRLRYHRKHCSLQGAVLTRGLIKKGAEVQIVITPAGKEFITSITLSALTSKPVISEFFFTTGRNLAQPCRSGPVGRCHGHSTCHSFYHRKDGSRHCRQHACHHISFNESSGIHRSGYGSGHVCPSVNPA